MKKNISNQMWFVFEDSEIYNFIKGFDDVTDEWLDKAKPGNGNVIDANYFSEDAKNKYYVDGKNVILDYSQQELEVAKWLIEIFGGKIYMLPRVESPDYIKTSDYLWNNQKWDLKTLSGTSKTFLDDGIKRSKMQANNFIIDITNNPLSFDEINRQVICIYNSKYRRWVDILILKKGNKLFAVYKRKNGPNP